MEIVNAINLMLIEAGLSTRVIVSQIGDKINVFKAGSSHIIASVYLFRNRIELDTAGNTYKIDYLHAEDIVHLIKACNE